MMPIFQVIVQICLLRSYFIDLDKILIARLFLTALCIPDVSPMVGMFRKYFVHSVACLFSVLISGGVFFFVFLQNILILMSSNLYGQYASVPE